MIDTIKRKVARIDDNKIYSVDDIVKLGVITDTKFQPSKYVAYKILRRGEIPHINLGTEQKPKYRIQGKDLKRYCKQQYTFK